MSEEKEQQVAPDMPINILAQYVRDMSFENPLAPDALRTDQGQPEMDINIGMDARELKDDQFDHLYEVVLNLRAEARRGAETLFVAELQYGATVAIQGVPEENHHPLMLIEIPRIIFPFARQIMSDMTAQGGYPPLMMNPVDFQALYMERFKDEIEAAKAETAKN